MALIFPVPMLKPSVPARAYRQSALPDSERAGVSEMDGSRFDEIARNLARGTTRRGLLAGLAGIAAGIAAGRRGAAQVSQAQCGNMFCKDNPGVCRPGCVCCVYSNGNSRCRPPGTCSPGWETCPADRPHIDPVRGCVQCLDVSHCPAPSGQCQVATCTAGVCGSAPGMAGTECRAATDLCDVAEACDGSTAACPADAFAPNSVVCRTATCTDGVATLAENCSGAGAACPPPRTQSCAPYHCAGTGCASRCTDDAGCVDGYHCDNGQCLLDAGLGTPCDENSDCESTFCVDGVCCNSACAGACDSCNGATPGVCATATCNTPGTCQVGPGACNAQTGACEYGLAQDETSCGTGGQICCGGICCDAAESCVEGSCQDVCVAIGSACAQGGAACCGTGQCRNGECCGYPTDACQTSADCCSPDYAQICDGGRCCVEDGFFSDDETFCCSGRLADDGTCFSCLGLGSTCDNETPCCLGGDEPLTCAETCEFGRSVCCHGRDDSCTDDCDCCGGLVCTNGSCKDYCVPTAGSCSDAYPCCDPDTSCVTINPEVCDRPAGRYCYRLRGELETCASDCECGTNFPKPAPYVDTACENGRCCLPLNRPCNSAADCCQAGLAVACQDSNAPATGDGPVCCIPDGGPCSSVLHVCCNGYCVDGVCGGTTCKPSGALCNSANECCGFACTPTGSTEAGVCD